MGNQVERMDVIGQNGNEGLHYCEELDWHRTGDVGDEQHHVDTRIEPADQRPEGAQYWVPRAEFIAAGWWKQEQDKGWWFWPLKPVGELQSWQIAIDPYTVGKGHLLQPLSADDKTAPAVNTTETPDSSDHIPDLGKMVTGQTLAPDGAQYWHGGNGLYPQGWYRLDADGWKFHDRHGSIWTPAEPPPPHEMQRIMPRADHIGDATEKADHLADAGKMITGVKADQGKARFDLIPPLAERAMAEVLTFGAAKYSPDNWRKVEDAIERYTAAALRHINARRGGEYLDPESSKPHMAHAMCCIAYVLELEQEARSERGYQPDNGATP